MLRSKQRFDLNSVEKQKTRWIANSADTITNLKCLEVYVTVQECISTRWVPLFINTLAFFDLSSVEKQNALDR